MQHRILIALLSLPLIGCTPQPLPVTSQNSVASPFSPATPTSIQATQAPADGQNPFAATPANGQNPFAPTLAPAETATAAEAPAPTIPAAPPAPTATMFLAPTVLPSPTPEVTIVPIRPNNQTAEDRWRAQQIDRAVFDSIRIYQAQRQASLYWYDPNTGQVLELGTIRGSFPAQATFTFRPNGQAALEIPYRINIDFGLTSVSEAILQRIQAAGFRDSVESFVYLSDAIVPQP